MSEQPSSNARENILNKLRNGLQTAKLPIPFPEVANEPFTNAFAKPELSMEEAFATEFIRLGGKFVFCDHERDLMDNLHALYDAEGWQQLLCTEPRLLQLFQNNKMAFIQEATPEAESADACITCCEWLVARTGSVLLSSKQPMGRVGSIFFPVHIIVAYTSQLVPDIAQGLEAMKARYGNHISSMINLNTGASRTSDIEKTLVVGVHGPKEVYCFLINH